MKLRLLSFNLNIHLKGTNQAFYLKNSDRKMELVKANFKGQESTIFKAEKATSFFLKKWYWQNRRAVWTVALSVSVFLFAGGATTFFLTRDTLENRLYDRYYRQIDKNSSFLFNSAEFNEARKRYDEGDPVAAWLIMKSIPDNLSFKIEKLFYQALISMELEHFRVAIQIFDTIYTLPNNQNIVAWAKWYQGLCYLKINDVKAAEDDFRYITPLYPVEYKKAQRILKKLNR